MRKEFTMTSEQYEKILEASKPLVVLVDATIILRESPQENVNLAWEALGKEMGFKFMTVLPSGKGPLVFTAEPIET